MLFLLASMKAIYLYLDKTYNYLDLLKEHDQTFKLLRHIFINVLANSLEFNNI